MDIKGSTRQKDVRHLHDSPESVGKHSLTTVGRDFDTPVSIVDTTSRGHRQCRQPASPAGLPEHAARAPASS